MSMIQRKIAAVKAFTAIGKKNGSAPPESTDNRFADAYELFIADQLRSTADARYKAAKARAIDTGILGEDYEPGTHVPYRSDGIAVVAKRNNDSTMLDSTAVKNELVKSLGEAKAKAILDKCTKPRKGNLIISVSVE